jgi:hypothetical protein
MSGLRDLVGGAGCSGGSGGAPSNPVASFADALLGGASKSQSGQLRELPGEPAGPWCAAALCWPC